MYAFSVTCNNIFSLWRVVMHKFYAHTHAHKHTQAFVHIKNLEVQISVLIHKSQSTFTDFLHIYRFQFKFTD